LVVSLDFSLETLDLNLWRYIDYFFSILDNYSMVDTLITTQEAEEVVGLPNTLTKRLRTLLMVVLGALLVVIATLLVLLLLSLRDSRTGWQAILPFLDSKPQTSLQIN